MMLARPFPIVVLTTLRHCSALEKIPAYISSLLTMPSILSHIKFQYSEWVIFHGEQGEKPCNSHSTTRFPNTAIYEKAYPLGSEMWYAEGI